MPRIKCQRCDQPAKYDSPEDLCQYHWIEWFADGDEEYMKEIFEDLGLKEDIQPYYSFEIE